MPLSLILSIGHRKKLPRHVFISLEFYSTTQGLPLVYSWSRGLEGGKNCQFSFSWMNTTTQTRSLKLKSNDFKSYPSRETAASGGKDADNISKVLCEAFIQWFWELNFCCYKYRVDCFGSLRLFFLLLLKWKSRNITKHLMSVPSGSDIKCILIFISQDNCYLVKLKYMKWIVL